MIESILDKSWLILSNLPLLRGECLFTRLFDSLITFIKWEYCRLFELIFWSWTNTSLRVSAPCGFRQSHKEYPNLAMSPVVHFCFTCICECVCRRSFKIISWKYCVQSFCCIVLQLPAQYFLSVPVNSCFL